MRILAFVTMLWLTTAVGASDKQPSDDALVDRGRYLTVVAGCGDCHTPGYAMTGQVDEKVWLIGDKLGFRGDWGTTYPTNLRLRLAEMNEDAWVRYARAMRPRPPMPWFNVAAMSDDDLRAIYRYIAALGPAGAKAPEYLPPDKEPEGPVVLFPAGPD